jgi:hypothetical protein
MATHPTANFLQPTEVGFVCVDAVSNRREIQFVTKGRNISRTQK